MTDCWQFGWKDKPRAVRFGDEWRVSVRFTDHAGFVIHVFGQDKTIEHAMENMESFIERQYGRRCLSEMRGWFALRNATDRARRQGRPS